MNGKKYKVRVLKPTKGADLEIWHENLTYYSAVDLFKFYVDAVLEFNLEVRCINIFSGKRCIKLFQNH